MIATVLILCTYAVATVTDIRKMEIPDYCSILLIIAGFTNCFIYKFSFSHQLLSFFILGLVFLLLGIKTDSIGGGDIKLIASTGFALGYFPTLMILFVGFTSAKIMLMVNKKTKKNSEVPLAPYLFVGLISVVFIKYFVLS